MNIIQIILILSLIILFIFYFSLWRKGILDKLIISFLIISGIIFVIKPNWLTVTANFLGIGRGADLLIYIGILSFGFIIIILFAKIRKIERTQTKIIRNNAIKNAHIADNKK